MKVLRALLIAIPLGLALVFGALNLAYYLEPTRDGGHTTLPIVQVVWPGGTRYQSGSFPEWEVRLPNGKITRLTPTTFRKRQTPDSICVRVNVGRWTGALHIEQAALAFCVSG